MPRPCAQPTNRPLEEAGGIDLQLLGLGRTAHRLQRARGHVPEGHALRGSHREHHPSEQPPVRPREDVPRQAYTMASAPSCRAQRARGGGGSHKAEIVKKAFFGPVTPQVPASILQFHPNATVIVDPAAGELCRDLV